MAQQRAHDCLVNVHFGDADQPDWMFRVKNDYFKKGDNIFRKWDMSVLLDEMDANGVERCVLMASAWAPKYLPQSLPHYIRTRGKTKIIIASDAPLVTISRTIGEAVKLDLPPDVMDNYLYANAQRFFFDRLNGMLRARSERI